MQPGSHFCFLLRSVFKQKFDKMLPFKKKLDFLALSVGIFFFYTIWAVLQERVYRGKYGQVVDENGHIGETFTFPVAFVAMRCIFSTIFAKGL